MLKVLFIEDKINAVHAKQIRGIIKLEWVSLILHIVSSVMATECIPGLSFPVDPFLVVHSVDQQIWSLKFSTFRYSC